MEMSAESVRKKHQQELDEKEQEVEDMRAQCQKKVKAAEGQLEDEYSEKQTILREKRELERKLQELQDIAPVGNKGRTLVCACTIIVWLHCIVGTVY